MTQELPSFARARCPALPSHTSEGKGRALGWLASTSVAALLVSAIGALAMTWESSGEAMGSEEAAVLVMLPPVPAIDAISEPTPDVADQAPSDEVKAPDTEDVPDTPEMTDAPDTPDETPVVEEIVEDIAPEVDQEPPPKPVVEVPKPKEKPKKEKPKEKKKAEAPKEKTKEPPKKKASEARAEAKASSKASNAQASTGSGKASAKTYAASVMKKVKSTRKQKTGERGTAVVSFTIADGGGLAGVRISKSSGSAAVDQVALDHIRRSAPFPPPPAGVGRTYSFNFKAN